MHPFFLLGLRMLCIQSNTNIQRNEAMQQPNHVPEHRVSEAVNPRTGRRERVFVNLEAVYPDYRNPNNELSFEELRAISRGWMQKDWRPQKEPLKELSGNVPCPIARPAKSLEHSPDKELPAQLNQKLVLDENHEGKAGKPRKTKTLEVKGETQTSKSGIVSFVALKSGSL